MQIIKSTSFMEKVRRTFPLKTTIGFVPTMGALHEGHLSLIRQSKKENDRTFVSIFVNPIQFGPREDFSRYPRPWKMDVKMLQSLDVDVLFAPVVSDMYPTGAVTRIQVEGLRTKLCGSFQFRGPEHFDGVATVVAKFFHLVQPTRSYFGLKDYQQVRVIEQMVKDLNFRIQIIKCATVREPDGLAMSSRNRYLSVEDRRKAPLLYAALQQGRKLLTSNPKFDGKSVCRVIKAKLMDIPPTKIDYIELVDADTLEPVEHLEQPTVLAAAIYINKTRLIDNIIIHPHPTSPKILDMNPRLKVKLVLPDVAPNSRRIPRRSQSRSRAIIRYHGRQSVEFHEKKIPH